MDRVRQIRAGDWIPSCLVWMLTPISVAQNDDVVRVLTDDWDQLLVVRFDDSRPRHGKWFVVGLEQNMRVVAIFRSHLGEEPLGFIDMPLGLVIVPIDEDVDALRDGRVDDQLDLPLLSPWILQITGTLMNAQNGTKQRALPIINHPIDHSLRVVLPLPLRPEEGHALQLYRIAMFTDDIVSCNTQPSMFRHGCPCRSWGHWGWRGPRTAGAPAAGRGRTARVETASALSTIGSRLVTPPSAIFAAVAAVCSEPAASSASWRGVR